MYFTFPPNDNMFFFRMTRIYILTNCIWKKEERKKETEQRKKRNTKIERKRWWAMYKKRGARCLLIYSSKTVLKVGLNVSAEAAAWCSLSERVR